MLHVQGELNRIAIDAYDRDSVLGDKPRIHVSLIRTLRVKKTLARIRKEKAASDLILASEAEIQEDNPTLEAHGDNLNVVPDSADRGTTEAGTKKATGREARLVSG